jgi:hypothetical protein
VNVENQKAEKPTSIKRIEAAQAEKQRNMKSKKQTSREAKSREEMKVEK